jgi:DNA-binding IclR family transcriptional regulator
MDSYNIIVADGNLALAPNAKLSGPEDRRSASRSASRALDILELFGEVKAPLRAIEIARALDLQTSTVDQLLKTLVDSSHLIFDARRKTYLPSPRLLRFSTQMLKSYFGDDRIFRILEDVHAETGALVALATPRNLSMQVLDLIAPPDTILPHWRGMRAPMFGSATGAAYLSTLSRPDMTDLLAKARLQPATAQAIMETVRRVESDGHAYGGLNAELASRSIAVPLPMRGAQPPLVIGLADEAAHLEPRKAQVARLMKDIIERRLKAPCP